MICFQKKFVFLSFAFAISTLHIYAEEKKEEITLETIYGSFIITEPLIIDLIESEPVQRLKFVEQYGALHYIVPVEKYSRYDHSIGVFALLRRFELPEQEQIAGLLHDVSHTVFSHVAEFVFDQASYQDDIQEWYLDKSGLSDILENHCCKPKTVLLSSHIFTALDQDLPNCCADRIDYNIQGGIRRSLITHTQACQIVSDLHFEEGEWFFDHPEIAKKFASLSLNMTEHLWGSCWSLVINTWVADALKRAVKIDLIDLDDIHFSTDDVIWHKLLSSTDPEIKASIEKLRNLDEYYMQTNDPYPDLVLRGKFRGIDPWVKTQEGLVRLTEIDPEFAAYFKLVKDKMAAGWKIKFFHHTASSEEFKRIEKEMELILGASSTSCQLH